MHADQGNHLVDLTVQKGKWYNMELIGMSGKMPMASAANLLRVRYSAAYPTMRRRSYASEGSRTKCARRDRKGPRAERMLRRETKITVAIYCGNQV